MLRARFRASKTVFKPMSHQIVFTLTIRVSTFSYVNFCFQIFAPHSLFLSGSLEVCALSLWHTLRIFTYHYENTLIQIC